MHGNITRKHPVYLYLKLAKRSYFPFYLFSSAKSENRKMEQSCPGGELEPVVGGR
jgi:hypothetical protein